MSLAAICPKCDSAYSHLNPPKTLINCPHILCHNCLLTEIRNPCLMQFAPSTTKESNAGNTPSKSFPFMNRHQLCAKVSLGNLKLQIKSSMLTIAKLITNKSRKNAIKFKKYLKKMKKQLVRNHSKLSNRSNRLISNQPKIQQKAKKLLNTITACCILKVLNSFAWTTSASSARVALSLASISITRFSPSKASS